MLMEGQARFFKHEDLSKDLQIIHHCKVQKERKIFNRKNYHILHESRFIIVSRVKNLFPFSVFSTGKPGAYQSPLLLSGSNKTIKQFNKIYNTIKEKIMFFLKIRGKKYACKQKTRMGVQGNL